MGIAFQLKAHTTINVTLDLCILYVNVIRGSFAVSIPYATKLALILSCAVIMPGKLIFISLLVTTIVQLVTGQQGTCTCR